MKIIALQAENIKRIVAVQINPQGNIVEITGKNGNGKTSILDSIWWALGGSKDIQKNPIRNGADTGSVRLDLDEIIVTRTFKRDEANGYTTRLTVENKEGVKFSSPQAMLDKLLGDLCFDPLAFARASADEQFNKLRQFVPDVDFKAIDQANKADYDARTDLNRRAKEQRASASAIVTTAKETDKRISEDALIQEMQAATTFNNNIDIRNNNRLNMVRDIKTKRDEAARLTKEAEELQKKLDSAGALPAKKDVGDLNTAITTARETNKQVMLLENKKFHEKTALELEQKSAQMTNNIEVRNADKQAKIAAAKLPVEGISFGDGVVMLGGVPFEQASDAEQLRASIGIAMALNSKLRIVRVRDGSLLDEDSMKILAEMADKNDCQVWVERVDGSGKVGFVIENGYLKQDVPEVV